MIKARHIFVFVLCALIAMTACRPKGVLSSSAMKEVLEDLHKTEAMLQTAGLKPSDQEIKSIYYAQVLERHAVTQAEFDSSLVWYTAHPQLFDKIYPKVIADLQAEEKELNDRLTIDKETRSQEEILREQYTLKTDLDTAYFELIAGLYPVLMHDTVDQLLPQVSVLGGGVVDTLQTRIDLP